MAEGTLPNQLDMNSSCFEDDGSLPSSILSTQNRFSQLESGDVDNEYGGGPNPSGEWSKVVNARKRQKMSSSGSGNELEQVCIEKYRTLPLDEKLAVIFCGMSASKTQISEIGSKLDTCLSMKDSINRIENKLETYDSRLLLLEYKSLDLEARSRRRNLLFTGFPENRNENCYGMIKTIINQKLQIHTDVVIDRAHRLGKYKQGLTRGIIVAFRDFADVGLNSF